MAEHKSGEKVTRVIAGAALLLAGADLAYQILTSKVNASLQNRTDIGLCTNENILKLTFGFPPLDLEGCRREWQGWSDQLNSPPVVPTPPIDSGF